MKCDRCQTEMELGKAIPSAEQENTLYDPCSPVARWPFELLDVLKCPSCGFSLSDSEIERRNEGPTSCDTSN